MVYKRIAKSKAWLTPLFLLPGSRADLSKFGHFLFGLLLQVGIQFLIFNLLFLVDLIFLISFCGGSSPRSLLRAAERLADLTSYIFDDFYIGFVVDTGNFLQIELEV